MEIIEACPEDDVEFLFSREIYWIDYYRTLQGSLDDKRTDDYLKNYLVGGGLGSLGTTHTKDHKDAIREGVNKHFEMNGHKSVYDFWVDKYGETEADRLLEEQCAKRSIAMSGDGNHMFGKTGQDAPCYGRVGDKHPMFGKGHTDEAKAKISVAMSGRKDSDSTKLRKSFAQHVRAHGTRQKKPVSGA